MSQIRDKDSNEFNNFYVEEVIKSKESSHDNGEYNEIFSFFKIFLMYILAISDSRQGLFVIENRRFVENILYIWYQLVFLRHVLQRYDNETVPCFKLHTVHGVGRIVLHAGALVGCA